jgi:hypothetical protein
MGKTFSLFIMALEFASKNKNWVIRFVMKEKSQAIEILEDIYTQLEPHISPEQMPIWKVSQSRFVFKNGSVIKISGVDSNHIEQNRGGRANIIILDEVASYPAEIYEYLIDSLLRPQLTTTKGFFVTATTPPNSPEHPYITREMQRLAQQNRLMTITIDDNSLISKEDKIKIENSYVGGRDNSNFQREYLGKLISNTDLRICPDFSGWNILDFDKTFTSDDIIVCDEGGQGKHLSACVRINISSGICYVKEFIVLPKLSYTAQIEMTKDVIGNVYPRIVCGDMRATTRQEFKEQKLIVNYVEKDTDDIGNATLINDFCFNRALIIHPSLRMAIGTLQNCTFNDKRTEIKATETYGHADGAICLAYGLKMMRKSTSVKKNLVNWGV